MDLASIESLGTNLFSATTGVIQLVEKEIAAGGGVVKETMAIVEDLLANAALKDQLAAIVDAAKALF